MAKNNLNLFDTDEFNKWKEEWVNMPEFLQGEQKPYKEIIIRFPSEEDLNAFAELIKQKLTLKTKSIWYPPIVRGVNANKRWVDES